MLCRSSGFELLQAASFPKLKRDHHCCRIGFLVQWSDNCEIQKTSATVFPVSFFFPSLFTLPVMLLSHEELTVIVFSQHRGGETVIQVTDSTYPVP